MNEHDESTPVETEAEGVSAAMPVNRREALQGALALAAGLGIVGTPGAAEAEPVAFRHGVASGDPLADRVIIWTRVTPISTTGRFPLMWLVGRTPDLSNAVARGVVWAEPENDWTVKVDVAGLSPNTTYYYRFVSVFRTVSYSPVGRTKTLPVGAVSRFAIAFFSCSNHPKGFFNVYGEAARKGGFDLVLHLGDYIYEYGRTGYQTPALQAGLVTQPRIAQLDPPTEILSLTDYRRRYALYRSDANLQLLHQNYPWVTIWDDHESANDSWKNGAENHQPGTEGLWFPRRDAAVKAYYEWMPIRLPRTGPALNIYRSFDIGNLARLIVLEDRLSGRDLQLDALKLAQVYQSRQPNGSYALDRNANGSVRSMLGAAQENFVAQALAGAWGKTWTVLGNQTLFQYQAAPNLLDTRLLTPAQKTQLFALLDQLFGAGATQLFGGLGRVGGPNPAATDSWTGYPTAREQFYRALATAPNPIVLTGDSHNAWAAELSVPNAGGTRTRFGVELAGASVSSPGYEEYFLGLPPDLLEAIFVESGQRPTLPDRLVYANTAQRGWVELVLTPTAARASFKYVDTVFRTQYRAFTEATFEVRPGTRTLTRV